MKSKQTTCGSGQARSVECSPITSLPSPENSNLNTIFADQTMIEFLGEGLGVREIRFVSGRLNLHLRHILAAFLLFGFCVSLSGCQNSPVASANNSNQSIPVDDPESQTETLTETPPKEKPDRLKRGEMPEEWIEPQRERAIPIDRTGDKLDLPFDDLKFDIEVGQAFERELLSEEVEALDGKEITLSGYMRPSFKSSGLKGFIFVRDDKECCFGPQAAIYDCVRVKLEKGATSNYLVRPFKIRGKFYLKEREGPDGSIWSIFNMKNATIER